MKHLKEILEGYCDPKERKWAVNAIGQTGLTARIFALNYYSTGIESLVALKVWRLGRKHFHHVYWPFLQSFRRCWSVEFLRISDKPKSVGGKNLTIKLFHHRFQNDGTIPKKVRVAERKLFDAFDAEYVAHAIYDKVRCKEEFHLDLDTQLRKPRKGGANIHMMTKLVVEWYKFVGGYVMGGEPAYVTTGAVQQGQQVAQEFYELMQARMRCWKLDGVEPDTFSSRR